VQVQEERLARELQRQVLRRQDQVQKELQIQTTGNLAEELQVLHQHQTGTKQTDLRSDPPDLQKVNPEHPEKAAVQNIKYYWLPLYQWFTQRKQTFVRWI
jgi:hypothetical protein